VGDNLTCGDSGKPYKKKKNPTERRCSKGQPGGDGPRDALKVPKERGESRGTDLNEARGKLHQKDGGKETEVVLPAGLEEFGGRPQGDDGQARGMQRSNTKAAPLGMCGKKRKRLVGNFGRSWVALEKRARGGMRIGERVGVSQKSCERKPQQFPKTILEMASSEKNAEAQRSPLEGKRRACPAPSHSRTGKSGLG